MMHTCPDMPIVIAANKTDTEVENDEEEEEKRVISREAAEHLVVDDWDNVYVECSAKLNENITHVFQHCVSLASNEMLDDNIQLISAPSGKKKVERRKSVNISYSTQLSVSSGMSPRKISQN